MDSAKISYRCFGVGGRLKNITFKESNNVLNVTDMQSKLVLL
jgi:hypothetical protein